MGRLLVVLRDDHPRADPSRLVDRAGAIGAQLLCGDAARKVARESAREVLVSQPVEGGNGPVSEDGPMEVGVAGQDEPGQTSDGGLRSVPGLRERAAAITAAGFPAAVVPAGDLTTAAQLLGAAVRGADTLRDLVTGLRGETVLLSSAGWPSAMPWPDPGMADLPDRQPGRRAVQLGAVMESRDRIRVARAWSDGVEERAGLRRGRIVRRRKVCLGVGGSVARRLVGFGGSL